MPKGGITPLWQRGERGDLLVNVNSILRPIIYYRNKAPTTPAPIITKVGSIFVKAMTAKLIIAIPKVIGSTSEVFPREIATAANNPMTAGFIPLKLEITITDFL